MVFQVQSYLERFQYTNVARSAAFLMVLWVITFILSNIFIKQWLKLREQARGGPDAARDPHGPHRSRALLTLVGLFFLFPIFWVFLMSFQTNQDILRSPPSMIFSPTLENYVALISGKLETQAGTLEIKFMGNLLNSLILSVCSVLLSLVLVLAAYAFARYKFRLGEDIAFTILSFRFAPPLLVLVPLLTYFQWLGLYNTYFGLIWVYQLITLPLILWITRGYFEDVGEDIEHAHASTATAGARPSCASRCRWPARASRRRRCWPSSSPGTTLSSR